MKTNGNAVMRQRQVSGWERIIHLTWEKAENLCAECFKREKFGELTCCQSACTGCNSGSMLKSGLRWQERERHEGSWWKSKGNREKSWWVKRDCSFMNISGYFSAPSSALITESQPRSFTCVFFCIHVSVIVNYGETVLGGCSKISNITADAKSSGKTEQNYATWIIHNCTKLSSVLLIKYKIS